MKIAELKKVEQESRIIEEFIQKFRRAVRNSRYEKRPLMKEFKRGINGVIRRNLIKLEYFPTSIKQQYESMTNLDKQEEKRLRNRRETRVLAQRTDIPATTGKTQRQQLPQSQVQPREQKFQQQTLVEPC